MTPPRPLIVIRAYWDEVVVIEEDAEFLETEYLEAA